MKLKLLILLLLLASCSTVKYIPVNDTKVVYCTDTIIVKDTIVPIKLPLERDVNVILLKDTSFVETSLASSLAYIDTTTHTIRHTIENKKDSIEVPVQYREKRVLRDSVIVREVPVEVKVPERYIPKLFWYLLGWFIVSVLSIALYLYIKIKG